jgi:hypothetical protein
VKTLAYSCVARCCSGAAIQVEVFSAPFETDRNAYGSFERTGHRCARWHRARAQRARLAVAKSADRVFRIVVPDFLRQLTWRLKQPIECPLNATMSPKRSIS